VNDNNKDWIVKLALVALLAAVLFGWTAVPFKEVAKTASDVTKALKK